MSQQPLKRHFCRTNMKWRLKRSSIESAYAGGERGREVIDALLPDIHV